MLGHIPNDGYTERGVLLEQPRIYPRVEFAYRPFTVLELGEYGQQVQGLRVEERLALMAGHLAGKIRKWDLKGADGQVLPITQPVVLSLKDPLFYRLWGAVTSQQPPDEQPDKSPEERAAELQDQIDAAAQNKTVAEIREARQRKNSPSPSGSP